MERLLSRHPRVPRDSPAQGHFQPAMFVPLCFHLTPPPPRPHTRTLPSPPPTPRQIIQTGKHTFVVELTLWPMLGGQAAVRALVPAELLSGERVIAVCPVIFSRGINEMQAISNMNIFAKHYELHVCR